MCLRICSNVIFLGGLGVCSVNEHTAILPQPRMPRSSFCMQFDPSFKSRFRAASRLALVNVYDSMHDIQTSRGAARDTRHVSSANLQVRLHSSECRLACMLIDRSR